jgi:hypothetical protein
MYVAGRLSNYYDLLKRHSYCYCLIIAFCVSVDFTYSSFLKREEKQESERVREESCWRELNYQGTVA